MNFIFHVCLSVGLFFSFFLIFVHEMYQITASLLNVRSYFTKLILLQITWPVSSIRNQKCTQVAFPVPR